MSETVDSSPEAIAAMVRRLRESVQDPAYSRVWIAGSPALLAQVARERDEARETIKDLECEIGIRARAARAQKDRADAAERQLAEARAVLSALEEAHRGWCNYCHGEIKYCDTRPECHCPKAREIARGAP